MPVKWTPETDQILLLKILETSQVTADVKAISEAWPKLEGQDAPTPRAISERLVKIRALAKENGSQAKFSVSSGKNSSAPNTPRKKGPKADGPKKTGAGVTKKGTARKRKRVEKEESSDPEDAPPNPIEEDTEETIEYNQPDGMLTPGEI